MRQQQLTEISTMIDGRQGGVREMMSFGLWVV
jgi:hypothetical protein